jgi:hypothetical protein
MWPWMDEGGVSVLYTLKEMESMVNKTLKFQTNLFFMKKHRLIMADRRYCGKKWCVPILCISAGEG